MKNFFLKHKKKLVFVAILVILAIVIYFIATLWEPPVVNSKLSANLESNTIISGESTFLVLKAYNAGTSELDGEFVVDSEESSLNVSYPDNSLLSFKLLPGESITRKLNVTATTKAIRTDYELKVKIVSKGNTTAAKDVILTVKKE